MRIHSVILLVAACGLITAQEHHDGPRRGGPGGMGGRGPMGSPSMRILDTDKDGALSAAEIQQAAAKFGELDANHDGKLTTDELLPAGGMGRGMEGRGGGAPGGGNPDDMVATLMKFDRNGDGILQQSELPERMQGIFQRGDANKDGNLTREELTQVVARQQQASQARPEGQGRGSSGDRAGMMMRFDPILRALDADQDGEISSAEWNAAAPALAKLDKDGDGKISQEEVRPNFPEGGRSQRDRRGPPQQ